MEWEKAARGTDGRKYPWGEKWDSAKCNSVESKIGKTTPVGQYEDGKSPYGCHDMAGNVWEWTLSDYHLKKELGDFAFDKEMQRLWDEDNISEYISRREDKKRQLPVLRGGSWFYDADYCRCAYRSFSHPCNRDVNVGFRCART